VRNQVDVNYCLVEESEIVNKKWIWV